MAKKKGQTVNWDMLMYFRPYDTIDNWGDPWRISAELLIKLDSLRHYIGAPLIVTSAYRPGDLGWHGAGMAVDVISPDFEGTLVDFWIAAERFNFNGIGVYRDWYQTVGGPLIGGLHLDVRHLGEEADGTMMKKGARWIGIKDGAEGLEKGWQTKGLEQKYLPLTEENLLKYGIIIS